MPLNDRYTNPGAAATSALFDFLADREARNRQAMLDDITRSTAARQDETARGNLALQREQMAGLKEQRESAADLNRQKKALGVIGMMRPGAAVDADTAGIIRQGGFGPLLQAPGVVAGMPREADPQVAADVDSALLAGDANALRREDTFRGTPQQQSLAALVGDPSTPEAVKAFLRARQAAGDEAIPYQLFQAPETQTLFRVSSDRRGVERFDGTGWAPHEGAIPKDAHWLQEPVTQSGEAGEMRRIGMFNRIADARERSPLVKAADRTLILREAANAIEKDATNPANQLNLAYSYIQALDTYQSAVREGELQNLGMLGTQLEQLGLQARRTILEGAFMPADVAKNIATSAKLLIKTIESGQKAKSEEFRRRAKASGVEDMWDATYPVAAPDSTTTATPNTPNTSPAAPADGWKDVGGGVRIREKKP